MTRALTHILYAITLCLGCRTDARESDSTDGADHRWISLYDGKTLTGWHVKCRPPDIDKKYWKVEKGAITADLPKRSRHHYIWLVSDGEHGDFECRLKIQTFAKRKGNSGIQIRSRYDDSAKWLDGPQVEIHPGGELLIRFKEIQVRRFTP